LGVVMTMSTAPYVWAGLVAMIEPAKTENTGCRCTAKGYSVRTACRPYPALPLPMRGDFRVHLCREETTPKSHR
jgi:hypothetical protein